MCKALAVQTYLFSALRSEDVYFASFVLKRDVLSLFRTAPPPCSAKGSKNKRLPHRH